MTFETLLFEVNHSVATITLNRPKLSNSLTRELLYELENAIKLADDSDDVKVVLLKGAGKNFCSGYGLDWSTADEKKAQQEADDVWDPIKDYKMINKYTGAMLSLYKCTKPVIAQVHGFAVGGGADLVLCADIIIASDDAQFGYPPSRVWGTPTTAMWAIRLGIEKAKRFLFTGDAITASKAAEMGMILESVPPEKLNDTVQDLVNRITLLPMNQLIMMKLLINQMYSHIGMENTTVIGTLLDGIARHTPEGVAWRDVAVEKGVKEALRQRDEPFGDYSQRPR
ncbi:crotonase/enoyl-CoA hydratase family protein [Kurthia sibirica]|uniref:Enoyl-CoA hydratase n=1 Tax=Kurthia sibirica TaxID=202750 RepID=A0A2U3AIK0_9BACL|nr:crotonase/enoyl-CoA hydratase family protein [Kurthia sibirica]PWI24368.1 enoyl-CoA hydratase [Kurthia sibirica]GEK33785.1 enoyl-CoA hydratase [Kurthia sibirica]